MSVIGDLNESRVWEISFSQEHALVQRTALELGMELSAFRIELVCAMFAPEHAGDVVSERPMAQRFNRASDDSHCIALTMAFDRLVQLGHLSSPSAGDIADLQACREAIASAVFAGNPWASVTLTSPELSSLRAACELQARLAIGQGWAVPGYLGCPETAAEAARTFDACFRELFFPELRGDAYYGINSQLVHDNARVAWDIQQVLRHHLAFEALGKVVGRDKRDIRTMKGPEFDAPMQRSRLELIRCSRRNP